MNHEDIARRYPQVMKVTAQFDARAVRDALLACGGPDEAGFIRFAYRPFDNRWLYWKADSGLLDRPRPDYRFHVFEGNRWFSAAQHLRKASAEPQACFTEHVGARHLIERGTNLFPAYLRDSGLGTDGSRLHRRPNVSASARRYLDALVAGVEDLFHHILAVLHDSEYRKANSGALGKGWPRIPLPGWPDGDAASAADTLAKSAARGRMLARLLDPDTPVSGVTQGVLRPEIAAIAVPAKADGRNMTGDDFAVTAGWGHFGQADAVMPGQGRLVERSYAPEERAAFGETMPPLGETTFDIYLNERAFWRNVPAAVWAYKLGGYQVLKKWLSYRERDVLRRPVLAAEAQHFTDSARRIAAILLLTSISS